MNRMPDITDDSRMWDQADTAEAMRTRSVTKQVLIVLACVVAILYTY